MWLFSDRLASAQVSLSSHWELGQPIAACFAIFDPTPLATASIGQAHAATLLDGAEVVVKVRRPSVVEQVEEDLAILQNLAAAASRRWEFADHYDLVGLAQEFAQTLRVELDYIREGHSAERFAANFAGDPAVADAPVRAAGEPDRTGHSRRCLDCWAGGADGRLSPLGLGGVAGDLLRGWVHHRNCAGGLPGLEHPALWARLVSQDDTSFGA